MKKNLVKPTVVMDIIDKYKLKMSKSLGQNFLIDDNVRQKIVDAGELSPEKVVVEIGPGIGVLTQAIAEQVEKVIAVELDKRLVPVLAETLGEYSNVEVINNDVLKVNLEELVLERANTQKFTVISNLPYYITTPIIMGLLEKNYPIEIMVFMMQKEVADRIVAKPGTKAYGSLSVAVQYYTETELVTKVPQNVFIPKPDVESAVVKFVRRPKPPISLASEEVFFKVLKAGFAQRRKTLYNTLKGNLNIEGEDLLNALEQAGIDSKRRAETLSMDEFAALANEINKIRN
ncbi:16S rRNA (adenine1518-N6/adenine1519-N6)-dimethyltransferase [Desulfitispora alkaliphila]|uniref:16S rRNA (adenine(1518)-N(6)/adenine(1519)-N(6))- dimethyltransferase RsmA n=1 Tax=Desulfitispora alkaliphila TaxID=622674 RepID=UPI003D1FE9D5